MSLRNFFQKPAVKYGLSGFACAIVCYFTWLVGVPVYREYQDSFAAREFHQYGVWGTYKRRFFSFVFKLDEMKALDQENEKLIRQMASLEKELEIERSAKQEDEVKEVTEVVSRKLKSEAGSELARVLQTIEYQQPLNLLPDQLYVLGLGYFRKNEYEQAAVILSRLIDMKEEAAFRKPENYLMTSIAWFKLKQYKLANQYLEEAVSKTKPDESLHRTALLWKAMIAQAQGQKTGAQEILTSMMARFPHSEEVQWVNHSRRNPAGHSDREVPEHSIQKEDEEIIAPKVKSKTEEGHAHAESHEEGVKHHEE